MLERFKDSVSLSRHSSASLLNVKHNNGFGIGLSFGGLMDLSRQRFNIQMTSAITNVSPFTINMFFHGVQTL